MRIIMVVGEGVLLVRRYERVQFSSLAIALSGGCFAPRLISPIFEISTGIVRIIIQVVASVLYMTIPLYNISCFNGP